MINAATVLTKEKVVKSIPSQVNHGKDKDDNSPQRKIKDSSPPKKARKEENYHKDQESSPEPKSPRRRIKDRSPPDKARIEEKYKKDKKSTLPKIHYEKIGDEVPLPRKFKNRSPYHQGLDEEKCHKEQESTPASVNNEKNMDESEAETNDEGEYDSGKGKNMI